MSKVLSTPYCARMLVRRARAPRQVGASRSETLTHASEGLICFTLSKVSSIVQVDIKYKLTRSSSPNNQKWSFVRVMVNIRVPYDRVSDAQ